MNNIKVIGLAQWALLVVLFYVFAGGIALHDLCLLKHPDLREGVLQLARPEAQLIEQPG